MSDYQTIDVTDWKYKDMVDLHEQIYQAVKSTQSVLVRELPHTLKMSLKQYNLLNGRNWNARFEFDNRLFRTRMNVMDVLVNGYNNKGEKL